jgi:hypothetical protein
MKGVLLEVDPKTGALCISTSQGFERPANALDVVTLEPDQMTSLTPEVLSGRLTGTVLGLLKVLYGDAFRVPHDYSEYNVRG